MCVCSPHDISFRVALKHSTKSPICNYLYMSSAVSHLIFCLNKFFFFSHEKLSWILFFLAEWLLMSISFHSAAPLICCPSDTQQLSNKKKTTYNIIILWKKTKIKKKREAKAETLEFCIFVEPLLLQVKESNSYFSNIPFPLLHHFVSAAKVMFR